MIKPGEIDKIAIEKGVRAKQVEKDYVISWILWGIARNQFLNNNLVFKGGTCLKKMYFIDYRYSEDMDFTLRNDSISNNEILESFGSVFKQISEESKIILEIPELSIVPHKASDSLQFKMNYTATHGSDGIKVDITRGEKMEFTIDHRLVLNNYSDLADANETHVFCYSLKEVLIEKATALMGRTIPRDLYDFYYLIEKENIKVQDVFMEFISKAKNKGHNSKDFLNKVSLKMKTFERDWQSSLGKQITKEQLPEFDTVWRKATNSFKDIMRYIEK